MSWDDLANILLKCTGISHLKNKSLDDLSSKDKNDLLIEQPVNTVRHFDRRFRVFVKYVVLEKQPFGKVKDVVWRIEMQLRGSPHIHCLWWCENAPNLDTANGLAEAPAYIDTYVTCQLPNKEIEPQLFALVNSRQRHNHTNTCFKPSTNKTCHFDFPLPLYDKTTIKPHDDPDNPSRMYMLEHGADSQYINPYNEVCLLHWGANMDIQLIGSVLGTVNYVCHYICKEESGMIQRAIQDALGSLPKCK